MPKPRTTRRLQFQALERREQMAGDAWPAMDNVLPGGSINGLRDSNFVVAGNFAGDAAADLVIINKQSGVNRVLVNLGNGQYETRDHVINYAAINGLYDNHFVLAGDFDRNGWSDVLYIHKQTGDNRLVMNQGNGQFVVRDGELNPGAINGMYDNHLALAGDFDGNGFWDVAFIHKESGGNRLILNQGNFQFTVRDGALPGGAINGMYDNNLALAGDVDGNGLGDLVFIHKEHGGNRILLNHGNWNFQILDNSIMPGSVNGMFNQNFAITGDFDRSGDAELLFINKESGGSRMLGTILHSVWFGSNPAPWNWSNGVVTINGTAGRDRIVVSNTEHGTRFEVNGGWGLLPSTYANKIVVFAGGGDDAVKNDTGIPSTLYGGDGNDELDGGGGADQIFGDQGNDILFGRGGNDTLSGGAGHDELRGGDGSDKLVGGAGDDRLFGLAGADAVYGDAGVDALFGDGSDYLYGGAGADRLLLRTGDRTPDANRDDARVAFKDGSASWTIDEIARVDAAFAGLQSRTNNTALLKLRNGATLEFRREVALDADEGITLADNDSAGTIRFADVAFGKGDDALRQIVYHEIAHNWDEVHENRFIAAFQAHSAWAKIVNASSALPTVASLTNLTSLDGEWRYSPNASFAAWFVTRQGRRVEYGRTNPMEDFATCFQFVVAGTSGAPAAKAGTIQAFLTSIRTAVPR